MSSEVKEKRFCKIAQPHSYVRFGGIGERPNKQKASGFRESGNPALFRLCIYTNIACPILKNTQTTLDNIESLIFIKYN